MGAWHWCWDTQPLPQYPSVPETPDCPPVLHLSIHKSCVAYSGSKFFPLMFSGSDSIWYGAWVSGSLSNTLNLMVRQFANLKVMFWYFFTYNEFNCNAQPQHNTMNITTMVMVVEQLAPPAALVWWIHTAQGMGDLGHVLSKAAVEGFCCIH